TFCRAVELGEDEAGEAERGVERQVLAVISGDFRLHGRKARQTANVELVFRFGGDKLESVAVKTTQPMPVNLEQYEINPRDGAGKFVKTITDAVSGSLKGKLQKEAPVTIAFTAKPK
ncbi:MAG TPA: hypothetical protein VFZ53_29780, partial [Polyangiaceae bacterium]